jgi:hypothetical protein
MRHGFYWQSVPSAATIFLAIPSLSGSDLTPSVQTLPFQFIEPARWPLLQKTLQVLPSLVQAVLSDFLSWYAKAVDATSMREKAVAIKNEGFMVMISLNLICRQNGAV